MLERKILLYGGSSPLPKNGIEVLNVLSEIPSCYFFRMVGWPPKLPINLTLSVTSRCNSRCKTCNIHQKQYDELPVERWCGIFRSLGRAPFWVTISGGEPFLRSDLSRIVCSLYDQCRPAVINIPTNGLLHQRIPGMVEAIARHCGNARVVINVSIDDIEERHDEIRGVKGNYQKTLACFKGLKSVDAPNLSIGIHTVVSRFNVNRIPEIYRHLRTLEPDSYISEIAQEREELNTIGAGITPEYGDYAKAVDYLMEALKRDHFNKIGKITRAFRTEYYSWVKRVLIGHRRTIPCYAGFASAQIAPDGDVWMCCTKAESAGNLGEADFDFRRVWFSEKAEGLRQGIKDGACCCTLANTGYTNMLFNLKSLLRIGLNLAGMK